MKKITSRTLALLCLIVISLSFTQLSVAKGKKPQISSKVIVQQFSPVKLSKEFSATKKALKSSVKQEDQIDGNITKKSQLITLVLFLLLGPLSIHNFYLGRVTKGVSQLVLLLAPQIMSVIPMVLVASGSTNPSIMIMSIILSVIVTLAILAWLIWLLIDFIGIMTGKLKPINGEYGETL